MVAADSDRISRVPTYSGGTSSITNLPVRDYHPLRSHFPDVFRFVCCEYNKCSYNPAEPGSSAVWAVPSSLATTRGIENFFLFLQVLRCFSSLRKPRQNRRWQAFSLTGCPIRRFADQVLFANTRDFSQLTTSFIDLGSQGIRRSLLESFKYSVNHV